MVRLEGIREDIEGRPLDGMRGRQTAENVVDCEAPVHGLFILFFLIISVCNLYAWRSSTAILKLNPQLFNCLSCCILLLFHIYI